MVAFVVRFSFSTSQEIGWTEHLRNQSDLFYVKWEIKPQPNQSMKYFAQCF